MCVCVCTGTGVCVCIPVCMAAASIPLYSSFPAQHWSWEKPGLGYSSCKAILGHFKSLLQIQALDMCESLLPELPAFYINTSLEKGAPPAPLRAAPAGGMLPARRASRSCGFKAGLRSERPTLHYLEASRLAAEPREINIVKEN